jgi:hypothetical protein
VRQKVAVRAQARNAFAAKASEAFESCLRAPALPLGELPFLSEIADGTGRN